MATQELDRLARAYQGGDSRSFRPIVDAMTRSLIAMAYRYTRDWESARDLTQDTWVKVHRSIPLYDPARSFHSWVYAIHRNTCLSHLRRAWVQRETPMDHADMDALGSAPDATAAESSDFLRRVFHALRYLSDSQRRVFCQVDLEQVDQREAAAALDIKFNTLRTTLHFARKKLARVLRDMEDSNDRAG